MSEAATTRAGLEDAWAPYRPGPQAPWNLARVVHLHRRAGFAGTWHELQRDLQDGPEASVSRLLDGRQKTAEGEKFERTAQALADAAVASDKPAHIKAWWVYRMLAGGDPLGERLTLLWHNHFATSNLKVDDLAAMRRQNELFRAHARAPFGELLNAAVRGPALLVWLDAPGNSRAHPNENLARELMELFTLGTGHYTEADVKEAARALTGWTVVEKTFREVAELHDPGEKALLGRKGRWSGPDVVRILLEQPATADRLAWRLCESFLGEGVAHPEVVGKLAAGLRAHRLDVGWAVGTILRSRLFFADTSLGKRVVGPAEFVIAAARALELFDPPPNTLLLADWMKCLGQDLFYPPNVGGWPGGRSWLTTRSALGRCNFAAALAEGKPLGLPGPVDALGLARRYGKGNDLPGTVKFLAELFLGVPVDSGRLEHLTAVLAAKRAGLAESARRSVTLLLAAPEAQLG